MPLDAAKTSGAAVKNPQRFRDRKEPKVAKLGAVPRFLNEAEAEAWNMFAEELPWLGASDRTVLTQASKLRARLIAGDLPLSMYSELRHLLSALGATPAARSKVRGPEEDDDDDESARFFQ